MSKKGAFVYQQIEQTTAEWAADTTIYPVSVFLFERLENGKVNMKLTDGVHRFAELPYVMQDVKVAVKQNDASAYILTVTTAAGEFDTPNLKGPKGDQGIQGETGDTGATGETGPQGIPGVDAPVPSIDPETKHWKIGDDDTGVVAEGKNGISVSVVENSENTETVYKLDITDKDGKKTTPNLRGTDAPVPSIDPATKHWKIGDKDTGVVAEGKNAAITDDAPSDGKTYGRNNGAWSEIVASNQYLDLMTLFPNESGTLSDENYQKVVDAWENRVSLANVGGMHTPMTIIKNETAYALSVDVSGIDMATGKELNINAIVFNINKNDKTYNVASSFVSFIKNGSGTKYLSDNGEYLTPPTATPTTAGYMSAEDKKRVDDIVNFGTGSNAVTTLVNIPTSKRLVKATLSSASNLSINESARALNVGEEIYLDCNPTASFTQPIPTTGSFRSMSGSSITTTSGVPFEVSILKIATSGVMYSITVKEQD